MCDALDGRFLSCLPVFEQSETLLVKSNLPSLLVHVVAFVVPPSSRAHVLDQPPRVVRTAKLRPPNPKPKQTILCQQWFVPTIDAIQFCVTKKENCETETDTFQ